jgi:hypothetical protein
MIKIKSYLKALTPSVRKPAVIERTELDNTAKIICVVVIRSVFFIAYNVSAAWRSGGLSSRNVQASTKVYKNT